MSTNSMKPGAVEIQKGRFSFVKSEISSEIKYKKKSLRAISSVLKVTLYRSQICKKKIIYTTCWTTLCSYCIYICNTKIVVMRFCPAKRGKKMECLKNMIRLYNQSFLLRKYAIQEGNYLGKLGSQPPNPLTSNGRYGN